MSSSYHIKARELLQKLYPTCKIEEEYPIKVGNKTYFIDLYINLLKLAVEVQGEQHFKFCPHFHKTKADFYMQKKRDREKREFLENQGITLVELRFDEESKWESQLK